MPHTIQAIFWCIMYLIALEFVFGFAVAEFLDARSQRNALRKFLRGNGAPEVTAKQWTLCHMFYANMGGFFLLYRPPGASSAERKSTTQSLMNDSDEAKADLSVRLENEPEPPGHDPSRAEKGSNRLRGLNDVVPSIDYHRYHLKAAVLRTAIENDLLSPRAVPKGEITDCSKFDWFARLIAIIQLVQSSVTIIARAAEHLSVSPAEVAVAASGVCSIISYALLYPKPKDATTTIVSRTYEEEKTPHEFMEYIARYHKQQVPLDSGSSLDPQDLKIVSPPPGFWTGSEPEEKEVPVWFSIVVLITMLFGGIHLTGWNLRFPTNVDKWLWRSSAIITTALPLVGIVMIPGQVKRSKRKSAKLILRTCRYFAAAVLWLGGLCYAASRIILIVEMIRTLFYLPPDAYLTPSWSNGIPHIG